MMSTCTNKRNPGSHPKGGAKSCRACSGKNKSGGNKSSKLPDPISVNTENVTVVQYEDVKEVTYRNAEGVIHRDGAPAVTAYDEKGEVSSEHYLQNGEPHREDGPAVIYYIGGEIGMQEYYQNGELHREDGPAGIYYDENGELESEDYFLNGEQQPKPLKRSGE